MKQFLRLTPTVMERNQSDASVLTRAVLAISACVLISCKVESNSFDGSSTQSSKNVVAESGGYVKVVLDNKVTNLEAWPVACGIADNGIDIVAKGRLPAAETENGQALLVLSIGGERRNNPIVRIDFTPNQGKGKTERVSLKGDDIPWFEGNTFQWSGKTDGGRDMSVKVVCP